MDQTNGSGGPVFVTSTTGITDPILVWEGRNIVLDGYERLTIAKSLKLKEVSIRYVPMDTVEQAARYRIGRNLNRRQMTLWHRAKAAVEFTSSFLTKRPNGAGDKYEEAAALYRVSNGTTKQALCILNDGPRELDPDVYQEVLKALDLDERKTHSVYSEVKSASNVGTGKKKGTTNDEPISSYVAGQDTPLRKSYEKVKNKLYRRSWDVGLQNLPDGMVDLCITSPPYHGITEDYGGYYNSNAKYDKYLDFLRKGFEQLPRVMIPGGLVAVNIDSVVSHTDARSDCYRYPNEYELYNILRDVGLKYFDTIYWIKQIPPGNKGGNNGGPNSPRLLSKKESILLFSMGQFDKAVYDKPRDLAKSEFNLLDENVWEDAEERNIWRNLRTAKRKTKFGEHPCPFNEELPSRLIKMFSNPGALVLDPFMGSGTTAVAAKALRRDYVGFDINPQYLQDARKRIAATK